MGGRGEEEKRKMEGRAEKNVYLNSLEKCTNRKGQLTHIILSDSNCSRKILLRIVISKILPF